MGSAARQQWLVEKELDPTLQRAVLVLLNRGTPVRTIAEFFVVDRSAVEAIAAAARRPSGK